MIVALYKTKKALKDALKAHKELLAQIEAELKAQNETPETIAAELCKLSFNFKYKETSAFGPEFKANGNVTFVGPGEYDRRWWGTVTVVNGQVIKVI